MRTNIILRGFKVEFLKIKGSFTYWFTLISAALIPLVYFLIFLFKYKYFIPANDMNIWEQFFSYNLGVVSTLLFSFYIILTIALNLNIEHKENSWKKLLLLPVSRNEIYFTKVFFLLLQVLAALGIFLLSIVIAGLILGLIHPELMFLEQPFAALSSIKLLLKLFISILGIFAIQFVISLFFKNIIIPVSLGIFLGIVSLIITTRWEHSIYFPYSFPALFYYKFAGKLNVESWHGINITEIYSIAVFVIVMTIGTYWFRNKQFN